ncbi:hypothetical protein GG804_01180 [Sphingomonas histidinilytica]|nr:hypothetical protein [Rhizorhabdus histidinilytica]MBO9375371.1 hypothetical protein [Rhizorhabdus histidinilytica]
MMDKAHFAAGHDGSDHDLHDGPPTPSQSGSSGGGLAAEIGSRDEAKTARGADPERTRATKGDKVQPRIPTRSDHDGSGR